MQLTRLPTMRACWPKKVKRLLVARLPWLSGDLSASKESLSCHLRYFRARIAASPEKRCERAASRLSGSTRGSAEASLGLFGREIAAMEIGLDLAAVQALKRSGSGDQAPATVPTLT